MVHFVGAGSGAPDLITLRGARLLGEADVVIYAGSLVNPELLTLTKPGCEVHDSAKLTLEEVIALIERAEREGKTTVRLHTGDPSIYGAVREQFDALTERGIDFDVCPGVSSFCGAAAAIPAEYTLPNVSQTVIITRTAGRTPVPERESIRSLAAHQATMVLFLSTALTETLQGELLAGGYAAETPAAIVYKATWPEEKIFRCAVGTLHKTVTENGMKKTALIVVGGCLGDEYLRSLLYHPDFTARGRHEDRNFCLQPRRLRGSAARSRGAGGGGNRLLRGTAIGRSGLPAACEGHLPRALFVDGCAHLYRRLRYRRA